MIIYCFFFTAFVSLYIGVHYFIIYDRCMQYREIIGESVVTNNNELNYEYGNEMVTNCHRLNLIK